MEGLKLHNIERSEAIQQDNTRLKERSKRFMQEIDKTFNDSLDNLHGEFVAEHNELSLENLIVIKQFVDFMKNK